MTKSTRNSRNMWRTVVLKEKAPLDYQLMDLIERGSAQGVSSAELEKKTGRSNSSVSAGMARLKNRNLIRYTGYDFVTETGRTAQRYGITPQQVVNG